MTTKATSVQLALYQVINNIKRNIGSFVATFQNTNNAITSSDHTLDINGSMSFTPTAGNAITAISVSDVVTLTLNFANGGSFTQRLNKILIIDSEILSFTIDNTLSGTSVDVAIING